MQNQLDQSSSSDINPSRPEQKGDQQFYRAILESLPAGVVIFDSSLQVVWSNPFAVSLTGRLDDLSDNLTRICHCGQTVDWAGVLGQVVTLGQSNSFSAVQINSPPGSQRLVDILLIPLLEGLPDRAPAGLMVLVDMTVQLDCLARRLAVSERMAALGQLAAKVAHELNNPLDGILRYVSLARRGVVSGHSQRVVDYLDNAKGGLTRMAAILAELLNFSRGGGGSCQPEDINSMLDQAITCMEGLAEDAGVSIITSYQKSVPPGPHELFEVFCNLVKNAVEAMPDGGTLTVNSCLKGDSAVIRFEDTGQGLPSQADRMFEPFFTTKPLGKGTGLGLAISKQIVEKCSGQITAADAADHGAVFTIKVPVPQEFRTEKNDSNQNSPTLEKHYQPGKDTAGR